MVNWISRLFAFLFVVGMSNFEYIPLYIYCIPIRITDIHKVFISKFDLFSVRFRKIYIYVPNFVQRYQSLFGQNGYRKKKNQKWQPTVEFCTGYIRIYLRSRYNLLFFPIYGYTSIYIRKWIVQTFSPPSTCVLVAVTWC